MPEVSALLDNAVLQRLERWRPAFSGRFTNRLKGGHLARKGGNSTEFVDYRDYVAGDDLRHVDWNLFARLRRPFLKTFHHEEVSHLLIVVDGSNSMLREGKFERARQLAAACAIMALRGTERVSVHVLQDGQAGLPSKLPVCSGRASTGRLLNFLEKAAGGGREGIDLGMEEAVRTRSLRGVALVISDFLTFGDLAKSMNRLFTGGLEVWGLQVLGATEMEPSLEEELRLVDSESDAVLDISPTPLLLQIYHEQLAALCDEVAQLCRQRAGRYLRLNAGDSLATQLFDQMPRAGWMVS